MHIQTHPTFVYTHPTSHTNILNHYHFILKQKKNSKDKTHPYYKISNHCNKNIKKNIKPNNNKNSQDKKPNNINISTIFFTFYKSLANI